MLRWPSCWRGCGRRRGRCSCCCRGRSTRGFGASGGCLRLRVIAKSKSPLPPFQRGNGKGMSGDGKLTDPKRPNRPPSTNHPNGFPL
ncbi:hypothetical protein [Lysobacter gummosus]|uniref:hypothetical protein n=1 Tax=Lysobacter gummosus TaxID=262324 RepID=UPI00363F9467